MNKDAYDNFMTTFKKNLWEICIKKKIFDNIDNSNFEKVKNTIHYSRNLNVPPRIFFAKE